ncbi:MAG: hypothetical protein ABI597_00870 [Gammaproteobacteria bacterium]
MQPNLLSLDDVKSHFEHWRATRVKSREKIPQTLWEEVKNLIDRYSLTDITSALRINTNQIKDNLKINTKINFAEAGIDNLSSLKHPFFPFSDKEQGCSIELYRANGVAIKINSPPMVLIQKLIAQFME